MKVSKDFKIDYKQAEKEIERIIGLGRRIKKKGERVQNCGAYIIDVLRSVGVPLKEIYHRTGTTKYLSNEVTIYRNPKFK